LQQLSKTDGQVMSLHPDRISLWAIVLISKLKELKAGASG